MNQCKINSGVFSLPVSRLPETAGLPHKILRTTHFTGMMKETGRTENIGKKVHTVEYQESAHRRISGKCTPQNIRKVHTGECQESAHQRMSGRCMPKNAGKLHTVICRTVFKRREKGAAIYVSYDFYNDS